MAHKILKEKAVEQLRKEGYDVFLEYYVKIGGKVFIVDVVGFKDDEAVAIECGRTSHKKIEKLREYFTEVIHYNYTSTIHPKMQRVYGSHISQNKALSKVFQRGKTQIPLIVRNSMQLKDGDKILWIVESGKWVIERA
jgi:Holliday junction resolvase